VVVRNAGHRQESESKVKLGPTMVDRTCRQCGAIFSARLAEVKRGGAIFCRRKCFDISREVT
jgi:hypothetical protein